MNAPSVRYEELAGKAPDLMGEIDIAVLGYEEAEYIVTGTAGSFTLQGERDSDGRWDVEPHISADFRTRILVRRPADPKHFSGTVVIEWNNVSGCIDASPEWALLHRYLAEAGHAWVGVSAQKVGIDGGGFVEGIHLKLSRQTDTRHWRTPVMPGRLTYSVRWASCSATPRPTKCSADSNLSTSWRQANRSPPPASSPTSMRSTRSQSLRRVLCARSSWNGRHTRRRIHAIVRQFA